MQSDDTLLEHIYELLKRGVIAGEVPSKKVLERVVKASLAENRISMRSDLHEEVDLIVFARIFRLAKECPDKDFGLETMPDICEE